MLILKRIYHILRFRKPRQWNVIPESNGIAERTSESYLSDPKVRNFLEEINRINYREGDYLIHE